MSRSILAGSLALLAAILVLRVCGAAERASDAQIQAELERLREDSQSLTRELDELRSAPNVDADHWADARIFAKAVSRALEFGPMDSERARHLAKTGIRRGCERLEAIRAGRWPWRHKLGRVARGFVSDVDDSAQPYCVIAPAGYDPARPTRLDVVLHGSCDASGIGELAFLLNCDGGDDPTAPGPEVDYIEVHPLGRLGENSYRFEGETDVDEAIEAVARHYSIDRNRIVLRGTSLGGVGAWQLGLKRPDRYVAIGPEAGPGDTIEFAKSPWEHFVPLDPLTPWQTTMLHLVDGIDYVANASVTPVVAAMGDQDPYYATHLQMERAFAKEGVPFVGLVDRGAGHGVTAEVRQEQLRLLGEYAARGRDPFPRSVRFVTWSLRFSRCHWLEALRLKRHYERAELNARVSADGSIAIQEPPNIVRFAIHPPAVTSAPITVVVGESKIEVPAGQDGAPRSIVLELRDGAWRFQGNLDEIRLTGKRPSLQGPIDDAFSRRFLCVRGTGVPWNPAIGAWAASRLELFADEWRRHYLGDLPVKNDTDVTEADLRQSNLILFGDPGSNSWIRQVLPHLPLVWRPESLDFGGRSFAAGDHAPSLIYPNPVPAGEGRYVVINSGHTYHAAELRFSYMVFPRWGDWAIVRVGNVDPIEAASDAGDRGAQGMATETTLDSGFFDESWGAPTSE